MKRANLFAILLLIVGAVFLAQVSGADDDDYQDVPNNGTLKRVSLAGVNRIPLYETPTGLNETQWGVINRWVDTNSEIRAGWLYTGILLAISVVLSLSTCYVLTCTDCFNGDESRHQAGQNPMMSDAFASLSRASSNPN